MTEKTFLTCLPDPGSPKCIQDESKDTLSGIHYIKSSKIKDKEKFIKAASEKRPVVYKTFSRFFSRNLAGQKGVG